MIAAEMKEEALGPAGLIARARLARHSPSSSPAGAGHRAQDGEERNLSPSAARANPGEIALLLGVHAQRTVTP